MFAGNPSGFTWAKYHDHKEAPAAPLVPLLYGPAEACVILHKGKTALYEAIAAGELEAIKDGRSTRFTPAALERYVARRPKLDSKGAA